MLPYDYKSAMELVVYHYDRNKYIQMAALLINQPDKNTLGRSDTLLCLKGGGSWLGVKELS